MIFLDFPYTIRHEQARFECASVKPFADHFSSPSLLFQPLPLSTSLDKVNEIVFIPWRPEDFGAVLHSHLKVQIDEWIVVVAENTVTGIVDFVKERPAFSIQQRDFGFFSGGQNASIKSINKIDVPG